MEEKIRWCMLLVVTLIGALIYLYQVLKKKITFRDWITGSLIYVAVKVFFYQIIYSLLLELFGNVLSISSRTLILCVLEAIFTVIVYLAIYNLFYKKTANSITAISLGFGSGCFEVVSNSVYTLFSYATMMRALLEGNIENILLNQGFTEELIPSAIAYINQISSISIITVTLQAVVAVVVQLMVSCWLYRRNADKENRFLIYSFGLVLVSNVINQVIFNWNYIIGLVLILCLLFICYYIVFCIKNNSISSTYDEKEIVIRNKKEKKSRR